MENELDRARTEKNYFAQTKKSQKEACQRYWKLKEKHRDEIAFFEDKI
jgi:hypothetical protein